MPAFALSVVDVTSFFSESASGGVRTYLTAKARALGRPGIRHTIVVPGETTGVEEWHGSTLYRTYNAADYYVAPGPGETFGLSIGEALACGLPVLCVGRGAGPDRIDGSGAGELYRHGDPADVARGLKAMNRHLTPEARARARAHAENTLDWSVTFDRLLALYGRLASRS